MASYDVFDVPSPYFCGRKQEVKKSTGYLTCLFTAYLHCRLGQYLLFFSPILAGEFLFILGENTPVVRCKDEYISLYFGLRLNSQM